jgi:hypothetical protein
MAPRRDLCRIQNSKRDRVRAKLALIGALKARLAERDADIRRCQRIAWIEPGEDAAEASELAFQRFEWTRRALIRVEQGMPYWRYAAVRRGELAGVEMVPTAAARRAYGEGVRG